MQNPIFVGRPSLGGLCLALLLALTSSVQAAPPDFTAPGGILQSTIPFLFPDSCHAIPAAVSFDPVGKLTY